VGERVVERHREALGDRDRDRAVDQVDAEALGDGGSDAAAAGPE
jgi:hypothetical protein